MELFRLSNERLEKDWVLDAEGSPSPGSFDLVQRLRFARSVLTAKHMIGDIKLEEALNRPGMDYKLKEYRAHPDLFLAPPLTKLNMMFDDMEDWCYEQAKKGENMKTLFWDVLKPYGPTETGEALLATLETWWKHESGADDSNEAIKPQTGAAFDFEFSALNERSAFPRQGVDFRKWLVAAYSHWLEEKIRGIPDALNTWSGKIFIFIVALVVVMWTGDASWLQAVQVTLGNVVPQAWIDGVVGEQMLNANRVDIQHRFGVGERWAGNIQRIIPQQANAGVAPRGLAEAVRVQDALGQGGNIMRILSQVRAFVDAVKAATSGARLKWILGIGATLVTTKIIHDYNRNYQPDRMRAWLEKNTPDEARKWKTELDACIGRCNQGNENCTGLYVFAVNRPQPGAPDVRLEILTRTIERYLQLWNEAYERANVWPLPRGTWSRRMVHIVQIETAIADMRQLERHLEEDWLVKYVPDDQLWIPMDPDAPPNLFLTIKRYVSARDLAREDFHTKATVRAQDRRDLMDTWQGCFLLLIGALKNVVEYSGMPVRDNAAAGGPAWNPAHPSPQDIDQVTTDLQLIRNVASRLENGMDYANMVADLNLRPAQLFFAIKNRINAILRRMGVDLLQTPNCPLVNPNPEVIPPLRRAGNRGGGGMDANEAAAMLNVQPAQAQASIVDEVFARMRVS